MSNIKYPVYIFKEPEKPTPVKPVQEEPVPTKPKIPPAKGRVRKTLSVMRPVVPTCLSKYKSMLKWQCTNRVCVWGHYVVHHISYFFLLTTLKKFDSGF